MLPDDIKIVFDKYLEKRLNIENKHEVLWRNDVDGEPLVIILRTRHINIPFSERFLHPEKMFEAQMRMLTYSLEIGDDAVPSVRIALGTGLMASVFGTEIKLRDDGPPYASHDIVVNNINDIRDIDEIDPLKDGALGNFYEHLEYFKSNLPPGIHVDQSDTQGPWNTAHLLRGTDIFTDVFDNPELVHTLLSRITDAMIKVVRPMKKTIGEPEDWLYICGTKARGGVRIANCSTDMISPKIYKDFVLENDRRYLDTMNKGFIHICGNNTHCVELFNTIDNLTGLEFNFKSQTFYVLTLF